MAPIPLKETLLSPNRTDDCGDPIPSVRGGWPALDVLVILDLGTGIGANAIHIAVVASRSPRVDAYVYGNCNRAVKSAG